MAKSRTFRFDMYLATSFLSYGVATITTAAISLFFNVETSPVASGTIVASLPSFLGGICGGYIAKGLLRDDCWKTALSMGLGAFLVNFIMSIAMSGRFEGMLWIFVSSILGSWTGCLARSKRWGLFGRDQARADD